MTRSGLTLHIVSTSLLFLFGPIAKEPISGVSPRAMSDQTLVIKEIYVSIQGESTWAGLPCLFVRLTGCDLRCTYCDSEYAFVGGNAMTIDEILREVNRFTPALVEITGGEPLLQATVFPLMEALANQGKTVLLETSGAHDIGPCDPRVRRIVDLKCPSSGEMKRNRYENMALLRSTDEVKFVIGDRTDFDWSIEKIHEFHLIDRCPILFSAVWEKLELQTLAQWVRDSGLPIRVQPQLHKILWGAIPST